MQLRALLAAAAFVVALPASATPQPRDLTDMWFDPAESGWGLNVIHQGDTLFATLFVYGPDGRPKWYVASNLTGGPATFSGGLQECTGPAFAASFDPGSVSCRQAGTMTMDAGDDSGTLDYTIDGVHVTKRVRRFTFRANSLAGTYAGFMEQPAASSPPEIRREQKLVITDDGSSVTMSTSNADGSCTWTGAHGQDGQYENVSGAYNCGSRSGTWSMRAQPSSEAFTGSFSGDGINGRIAAASLGPRPARGNGFRSDMWFSPSESGWGVNVIEQGDSVSFVLFATLFVYDAQGRAHWYVAPAVERHDLGRDENDISYLGTLFEATGPYFGASFNPAAVTRRAVGSFLFHAQGAGRATIEYTVDGVRVDKAVERFAFRKENFSGTYLGHQAADTLDPLGSRSDAMTIAIDDNGASFAMQTTSDVAGTCNYVAPASQSGRLRIMSGTYSCTNGGSGAFTMSNATVSSNGFTARFQGNGIASGHIAGVRR